MTEATAVAPHSGEEHEGGIGARLNWLRAGVLGANDGIVSTAGIVIVFLIPLALRGVRYRAASASQILSRNLAVYGLGGVIAPFIGIKLIDLVVSLIPGF